MRELEINEVLKIGESYKFDKSLPLMPEFDPDDPMEAIERVVYLDKHEQFSVNEIKHKRSREWYSVSLSHGRIGWINSIAMMGAKVYNI